MNTRLHLPPTADLMAFETAARHGSFTRAAEELNITQSAVSRTIRALEDRLGVTLFERVRKRVVLSTVGSLYLQDVRPILGQLRDATHRAMGFATEGNPLNIAVLATFATRWLVPRLPLFARAHPEITINLLTRLSPFDFAVEPLDAAIHYGSAAWPGAATFHLMNENMSPVLSPSYRSSHQIETAGDFAKATLLHQTSRPDAWAQWFDAAGVATEGAFKGPRYEQFSMIAQAAVHGLGAAILPRMLIDDELASGRLLAPFGHSPQKENAYYLVVPEAKLGTPHVRTFVHWLKAQADLEVPQAKL